MDFAKVLPRLSRPLSLGAKGPEVKVLQEALNIWDDDHTQKPLSVDGHFGKQTHFAVIFLQFWENLKEDGVVGPKTAEKLGLMVGNTGSPVIISFDQPPRPPMTPPLTLLIDVVAEGLRPLRDKIEDSLLLAPGSDPRRKLLRRDQANEGYDDLIEELRNWAADLPEGNRAVAQMRISFQNYVRWMHSTLDAAQFDGTGGWMWRFGPYLDRIPFDQIAGVADRVLRGEQTPVVAVQQLRIAFEQFNQLLAQVRRVDDNGVGPDGKATLKEALGV